jgi:hypothetical protein
MTVSRQVKIARRRLAELNAPPVLPWHLELAGTAFFIGLAVVVLYVVSAVAYAMGQLTIWMYGL